MIAGQNIGVVKSILTKMLIFQGSIQSPTPAPKIDTSESENLATKVDVQWTEDEMKALTNIFKSIV